MSALMVAVERGNVEVVEAVMRAVSPTRVGTKSTVSFVVCIFIPLCSSFSKFSFSAARINSSAVPQQQAHASKRSVAC